VVAGEGEDLLSAGAVLRTIWKNRLLLRTLASRELKSRYRGSYLGFLWSLLNPLLLMLAYLLVFSVYVRIEMENYAAFLLSGLLPWIWFSGSLTQGVRSVLDNGHLIKKVMFPVEILPAVAVSTTMVNFLLSLPVLAILLASQGHAPSIHWLALPLLILLQAAFCLALALPLSALQVALRDTEQVVTNVLNLLFFMTPIIYPVSLVPESLRFASYLNPMTLLVGCYHAILVEGTWPRWDFLGIFAAVTFAAFVGGAWVFARRRESFPDEV
jgi:ABC-type polysaccharide/polyol phosphate export permease